MKPVRNILITDVSHPVTASVIEVLRSNVDVIYNIIGIDHSITGYAAGRLWTDHHYIVPPPSDTTGYIEALLVLCEEHSIDVIVPWTDDEVFVLAQHAATFKDRNTKILASSLDSINKILDKYHLMCNLEQSGFAVPSYYSVDTIDELVSAVDKLGYPDNKVVVKPRNSSGARGFCLLDEDPSLAVRGFSSLPFAAYLELIKRLPESDRKNLDLIAMEYLSGEDYSVDVLANEEKVISAIPRVRLQAMGGVSSVGETVDAPEVSRAAARVVSEYGLTLNINVQMRYRSEREGELFVYDVNPRISGTIAANSHASIDFLHGGIQLLLGHTLDVSKAQSYRHTVMMRRWKEEYVDFNDRFQASVE